MNEKRMKEEYLETLWYMDESKENSLEYFNREAGEELQPKLLDQLKEDEMISVDADTISLTEKGRDFTRRLIRSHRLAERLVHDVLGAEFEAGACEFEHIVNPDLVDSICTLLGHPRECPHGMPIPRGKCCIEHAQIVESSVIPLDQLEVGETARIAYVYAPNDQQLHRLENLLVRPGMTVKLHQRYPSFVIECENSHIALDERVAADIHVWVSAERHQAAVPRPYGRRRRRHELRHNLRRRQGG
ncbi:MAG: metal-dependent transcriptional regulator [Spirochaetales bacterium]|nr:metal-dependent transcriptional regulator [Spirochaetales bacterium]